MVRHVNRDLYTSLVGSLPLPSGVSHIDEETGVEFLWEIEGLWRLLASALLHRLRHSRKTWRRLRLHGLRWRHDEGSRARALLQWEGRLATTWKDF